MLALLLLAPELLGHQALLGPDCLPLFTRPPTFQVAAGEGPFSAVLVGVEAREHALVVDERPPGKVLRSREDTPLPRGIGVVILRGAGGELGRWSVVWDADLGAVDAAVARARTAPPGEQAAAWEAAAQVAADAGVSSEVGRALRVAAWQRIWSRAYGRALELVARARAEDARCGHPLAQVLNDKAEGMLRHLTGDHLGAERLLASALAAADALGADDLHPAIAQDLAGVWVDLGRAEEAWAVLAPLAVWFPEAGPPRAQWLANLGWAGLHLPHRHGEARRHLEQALAEGATDPRLGAVVRVNLAGLALRQRQLADARAHLAALGAIPRDQWAFPAGDALLIEGELGLLEGAGAEAAFTRARDLADRTGDGELAWRAEHGLGRVAWRQGDVVRAHALFRSALAALYRRAARTALARSRAPYLASRRALIDDLRTLLVAEGRVAEAVALVDAHRGQVLRALEAGVRLDREAPAARTRRAEALGRYLAAQAELERRAPERDLLHADQLPAWDAEQARARAAVEALFEAAHADLTPPPSPDLAAIQAALGSGEGVVFSLENNDFLLRATGGPVAVDGLAGLDHVYLTGGTIRQVLRRHPELEGLSWSRLPFAGLLVAPVTPADGPPLVVADPTNDLPAARAEGQRVARHLGVEPLIGEAAGRAALEEKLAHAPALHFAGHGALGGASPWNAHLRLAGGAWSLADLLALRPRVGRVVLSGCETGVAGHLSTDEDLGLPEAFLAVGARSVVAALDEVGDTEAARFMEVFYANGGHEHPGPALLAARKALGRTDFELWGRP